MVSSSSITLNGKSDLEHIVAIQPVTGGRSSEPAAMRLYRRNPSLGCIETVDRPVYPFFFLSDIERLSSFGRDRFQFQPLAGDNHFRYLVVFSNWKEYWDALNHMERHHPNDAQQRDVAYCINSPTQQYLMQSGETCFKGMALEDLHRMQLDIEVYSTHNFPNPKRPGDQIIIIALSDNRGWSRLLHTQNRHEKQILEELIEIIQSKDPDVIEGHNIFAFDLMYLRERCRRYKIPFTIGRDRSQPRSYPSSMRFAERTIEFPAVEIAGRHIIDTYFQVMAFDVFKRDLPGYGLKTVAHYFGFSPGDRTYIEGKDISTVWNSDPDRVLRYALDDVVETERIARHLSGSTFYLTQMVPSSYEHVARSGPAAKIESLFVREYLRQKQSIPQSDWGSQTMGGYTDIYYTGVAGPIVYADVESLYPSIMLNYDVCPSKDTLKLFPGLLEQLTRLRLETKQTMKGAATEEERSELDALQSSYKILINSFYGSLGFTHALFNDFSEADRVAALGQEILRTIIAILQREGATVIEVDTDGVLFVPPDWCAGESAERAFVTQLSEEMPKGIRVGFDGRFRKMLSYKKKNYALLTYEGDLKFKGSSLVSRSIERFGREFLRKAIALLLAEEFNALHDLYLETRDCILRHGWDDVASFSRTETLKDSLQHYQADVKAGRRSRAASYELALRRHAETGKPARKGDRISFYIAGSDPNATAFECARFADEWSPDHPDENSGFYLRRLDDFTQKLEPFFEKSDFRMMFSPEDLFGFTAEGITLRSESRAANFSPSELPF